MPAWTIAKKLLGFERTMIADVFLEPDGGSGRDRLLDLAARTSVRRKARSPIRCCAIGSRS